MATCPYGHESASDDFCDVCGMPSAPPPASTGRPAGSQRSPGPAGGGPIPPARRPRRRPCPRCGTPRTGQFCEACGYNFAAPAPSARRPPRRPAPPAPPAAVQPARPGPAPRPLAPSAPAPPPPPSAARQGPTRRPAGPPVPQATWTAVVTADRVYYERVQAVTGPDGAAVTFPAYYPTPLPARRQPDADRAAQRHPAAWPGDRPDRPARRSGHHPPARGADREADGNWAVLDPGSANGTLVNGSEIGGGTRCPSATATGSTSAPGPSCELVRERLGIRRGLRIPLSS